MPYIYESHLDGELYSSDEDLDIEDRYCEVCGDYDTGLGFANNKEEAWELLKDSTDIDGSGGLDYKHVQKFINRLNFD